MLIDGLYLLLAEIERQLDVPAIRRLRSDPSSVATKLVLSLEDEYDECRYHLIRLRSELHRILNESPNDEFATLPPDAQGCLWKLLAYCRQSSSFIQPAQLKTSCLAIYRMWRQEEAFAGSTIELWNSSNLRSWANNERSSLIVVQGSSHSTDLLGLFSCEFVHYLDDKCPSLYMLNNPKTRGHFKHLGALELLTQIASQGLQKSVVSSSIQDLVELLKCFQEASTATDWFCILERIMQKLPLLFIVIDFSVLQGQANIASDWIEEFRRVLLRLEHQTSSCIKIMILTNRKLLKESAENFFINIDSIASQSIVRRPIVIVPSPERNLNLPIYVPRDPESSSPATVQEPGSREDSPHPQSAAKNQNTSAPAVLAFDSSTKDDRHIPQINSGLKSSASTRREEVDIAIICALSREADAVETLCDDILDINDFSRPEGDTNIYSVALLSSHKVVIVYMPGMGKSNAAIVASICRSSFPKIRLALLVGICGGVPFPDNETEILLGDVAISEGLVLYDQGRQFPDGFRRKNTITDNARKQPPEINAFLAKLKTRAGRERLLDRTSRYLNMLRQSPGLGDWATYPGLRNDILFDPRYLHKHYDTTLCKECADIIGTNGFSTCDLARETHCVVLQCDLQKSVPRKRLGDGQDLKPAIHFGNYASGDRVMKSGLDRDEIAREENIIAFEMEAAGIWDNLPCIIVKGVCDYADSHKNKDWQNYAATTAAACVKAMLQEWPVRIW